MFQKPGYTVTELPTIHLRKRLTDHTQRKASTVSPSIGASAPALSAHPEAFPLFLFYVTSAPPQEAHPRSRPCGPLTSAVRAEVYFASVETRS